MNISQPLLNTKMLLGEFKENSLKDICVGIEANRKQSEERTQQGVLVYWDSQTTKMISKEEVTLEDLMQLQFLDSLRESSQKNKVPSL